MSRTEDYYEDEEEAMFEHGSNMNKFHKTCWDRCIQGTIGDKLSTSMFVTFDFLKRR
jgi:hypothetical protein